MLTLTAISIDRYYAICHPLRFKSNLSQAKRIIVLIWLVSFFIMTPDLIYLSAKRSFDLEEAQLDTILYSDCNFDWPKSNSEIFQFGKTFFLYLLPFILMFCAHYKIMKTLQMASNSSISGETNKGPTQAGGQDLEAASAANHRGAESTIVQLHEAKRQNGSAQIELRDFKSLPPTPRLLAAAAAAQAGSEQQAQLRLQTHQRANGQFVVNNKQIRFSDTSEGELSRSLPVAEQTSANSAWPGVEFCSLKSTREASKLAEGETVLSKQFPDGAASKSFPTSAAPFDSLVADVEQTNHTLASKQSQTDQASPLTVTMHNKHKLESRRAAANMLMAIVILFGICYLPVHLINFLR